MKRWVAAFLVVLAACVPIALLRSKNPELLHDGDTAEMLLQIRERSAPLSWFGTDWPLKNGFYRPVSTLSFELDNAIWGDNPSGYALTNAVICILSVFALLWFLRELLDDPFYAATGAFVFAGWHWSLGATFTGVLHGTGILALAFSLLPGRRVLLGVAAFLSFWYLGLEANGLQALQGRMLDWLPGRTAGIMTLFALLSLASYARYERLSAGRSAGGDPSLLEPPATKGTPAPTARRQVPLWLPVVAMLFLALALLSYEQAIVLPVLLLALACVLRARGMRVRWGWHASFFAVALGYLALRAAILPLELSGYQQQQLRLGQGALWDILDYVMITARSTWTVAQTFEFGWEVLLIPATLITLLGFASNAWAFYWARRRWLLPAAGLALSLVAFLPTAFAHHFAHYHYLPMALRSLVVAALLPLGFEAFVTAASRPAISAPPRPCPAPGSLPRR